MTRAPRAPFAVRRAGPAPGEREAFARLALPHLSRRETHNNLPIAILDHIVRGRYLDAVLLRAEDARGDTAAVLIRTPPHDLLVPFGDDPGAREVLLESLATTGDPLPGMAGPLPDVDRAATWWSARTGVPARRRMHQGVYRLRAVTPSPRSGGRMRLAEADDRPVVVPWLEAFALETSERVRSDPALVWDSFLRDETRRLHLWEAPDGEIVSLAGVSGRTPNGARVGPVYTPPARRRRGFAGALVAALSQALLAAGVRFCFLYTDLDDPTSNRVYRDVGYELVCEAAAYEFTL